MADVNPITDWRFDVEAHAEAIGACLPPRGMTSSPVTPYKPAQANAAHDGLRALLARLKLLEDVARAAKTHLEFSLSRAPELREALARLDAEAPR